MTAPQFIPRMGVLAVAAVVEIARHKGPIPLDAKTLAERLGVSAPRRLEPTLQALVRVGVLKSRTGPHGGYRLVKAAADTSLHEVILAACYPGEEWPAVNDAITRALDDAESAMLAALECTTIADLVPVIPAAREAAREAAA